MKHIKISSLVFIAAIMLISCKKSNDAPVNWAVELKGSAWAGEFSYDAGSYTGLQPFSIVMDNGTLNWYQASGTYPASWSVTGNKVTMSFPDGRSLSANLSNDSWSDFTDITPGNGFHIGNLSRSVVPHADALNNTIWKGKYSTEDLTISFLPGQKVGFASLSTGFTAPYTVYGAGIKYTRISGTFGITSYGVFINNTTIKGVETDFDKYVLWNEKK